MGVERDELEREAELLYRRAGLDPASACAPSVLVRALLGAASIRFLNQDWLPGGGSLARVGAEWRIYLRQDLPIERMRFIALHELAHWALGSGATELDCDRLAARLLAPAAAFERALAAQRTYRALARWFHSTETFAALRVGEVTGEPLAVVAPGIVRVRGRSDAWPDDAELRKIVTGPKRPGIRRAVLRDDPRRTVLSKTR